MATIAENLQRILNATRAIKDAIVAKGGSVTGIESYADAINNLKGNEKQLITFYVNYTPYTAELGMTWEEFINSEYKTNEFQSLGITLMYRGAGLSDINSTQVYIFHTITSNRAYTIEGGGGDM